MLTQIRDRFGAWRRTGFQRAFHSQFNKITGKISTESTTCGTTPKTMLRACNNEDEERKVDQETRRFYAKKQARNAEEERSVLRGNTNNPKGEDSILRKKQ